jgi:hypothetical protein
MDEITVLREFRAGEPGPSPELISAARGALLAAIEADSPLHPAAPGHGHAPRQARSGRVRLAIAAGAIAGLAAVAVGAAAGVSGPGRPAPAHAQLTAALVLRQAAAAVAHQVPASGRVFFAESESVAISGGVFSVESGGVVKQHVVPDHYPAPALQKFWLSRHGGALVDDPAIGPRPVRVHGGIPISGRKRLPDGGFLISGGPGDYVSWRQISQLPTAQGPLRAYIAGLARKSGDKPFAAAEFQAICQLLNESPAPPAVRAALYDLAATLPGAKLIQRTHDLVGRAATEVYLDGGSFGQALLFSPATGAVLGEEGLSGSSPSCPPLFASAVLASGYVRSLGQELPGAPSAAEPASFPHSVPGCSVPGQATP